MRGNKSLIHVKGKGTIVALVKRAVAWVIVLAVSLLTGGLLLNIYGWNPIFIGIGIILVMHFIGWIWFEIRYENDNNKD